MDTYTIAFHYPCADGAFAMKLEYDSLVHSGVEPKNITLVAVDYRQAASLLSKFEHCRAGEIVYFLDTIGSPEVIVALLDRECHVIVVEHHEEAYNKVKDIKHKNLVLAYKSFQCATKMVFLQNKDTHLRFVVESDLEKLVGLIDDHDRQAKQLEDTDAYYAGLCDLKLEYDPAKNSEILSQLDRIDVNELVSRGKAIVANNKPIVASILEKPFPVRIGEWDIPTVIVTPQQYISLSTELGVALANQSGHFGMVGATFTNADGSKTQKFSVRSIGEKHDTRTVANMFGGGGHFGASGFVYNGPLVMQLL
jgi:hypothetical protein